MSRMMSKPRGSSRSMGGKLPVPDLSDDQILRVVSGIRPCRQGGMKLDAGKLGKRPIVHNYGHGGCGVTLSFGCAEIVCELMDVAAGEGSTVAVLGGGAIGLTSALLLKDAGYNVSVHAASFGEDTTSCVAGALWLPTGIDFPKRKADRAKLNDALRRSARRFGMLDRGLWGIEELPVYEPAGAEDHPEYFESGVLGSPRELTKAEPKPGGITEGRLFRANFIHTPRFMRTLAEECQKKKIEFVEQTFENTADVRAIEADAFVNCLALGSRDVFNDQKVYPARGVLVHMQPQELGYIVHDGYDYLFPREDALILGGTFEPDEDETEAPEDIAQDILQHHREFFGQG
ncbi:MAG: FAD-dependent oxidoreductase [Planctomycetota bacterium]